MKLNLESIVTKMGPLPDQKIELGEEEDVKVTSIFESPTVMVTIMDIDNPVDFTGQVPLLNTLVISGSEPFIVFSVHYDRRYITRKFRNYR